MTETKEIETGHFSPTRWLLCPPDSIRLVNWNIDRGSQLQRVIEFLASSRADIVLLQKADLNAKRTHHANVAREVAKKLQMNYVFGREFQELTQGTHAPRPIMAKPRSLVGPCRNSESSVSRSNRISGAHTGS